MKTVAIVGSATTTRDFAPWDDLSKDIWVFNEAANIEWCKRVNGVFQLHDREIYTSPHNRTDAHHWEWLQQEHGFPIWMQEKDPQVPNSEAYPLKEISDRYCKNFTWPDGERIEFFSSTVAYAAALAIYKQYNRIEFYGCEMGSSTEYQYQRDGVAFWIGVALGCNIEIMTNGMIAIFDQPLYGYDGQIGYSLDDITKELPYLEAQAKDKRELYEMALEYDKDNEQPGTKEYYPIHSATMEAANQCGYADGMLAEARRYIERYAPGRQELEQASAGLKENFYSFLSMMNYESGRAEAYLSVGAMERYQEAIKKQLDLSYSAGVENGRSYFNKSHMLQLDLLIRSAGGKRAADIVMDSAPKE